jgi:hypothetical protein
MTFQNTEWHAGPVSSSPVEDLPGRLAASIPVIHERWGAEVRSAGIGAGEPYNEMAVLARVLVELHDEVDARLVDLVDEFERELARADPRTRNLLIVGFLEDLQNSSLRANLSLDWWVTWLGPVTRTAWTAVQRLWSGALAPADFNVFVDGSAGDIPER